MTKLKPHLNFKAQKKTLIITYFSSNFNYCPLVWIFSTSSSKVLHLKFYNFPFHIFFYKNIVEFSFYLYFKIENI